MLNTDNPFRSSDLGVMSPARCLCAMSVNCLIYQHLLELLLVLTDAL